MPKLLPLLLVLLAFSPRAQTPPRDKPQGVKTPGVQIPIAQLKPEAVYEVPGTPDWLAIDDHMWVSNSPKGTVSRLDPKNSTVAATVATGKRPCSGLAVGFGSLWVPNCGDQTLVRVDLKTNAVTATIPTTIGSSEGGIATGASSVWLVIDKRGTLVRFDPATNKPVAEIRVPPGSYGIAFGEGAVWTLNQGDGSISRVDPKTNKVVATIEAGISGEGGEISAGEGSVWATIFGFPITRIDPATNKVVQQFVGPGGDAIRVGRGFIWLSNLKEGNVWRLDPRRIEATVAF
jgi:virginiamycin B lyase